MEDLNEMLNNIVNGGDGSNPEPDDNQSEPQGTEGQTQTDPEPNGQGTEGTNPEGTNPEGNEPEGDEPPVDDKGKNKQNPIRQMRNQIKTVTNQNKQYEAALEKIAQSQGITTEELIQNMQHAEDTRQAKEQDVPVEVMTRLREQEERIKQFEQEQSRQKFFSNVTALQSEFGLDDTKTREFISQAGEQGFDLVSGNVDFKTIYFALNQNDIINKAKEDAVQQYLAEEERKRNAPTNNRSGGGGNSSKQDINGLFNSLSKDKSLFMN